jgi:formylglycine-generating enzyme required for sulfatase activity
MPRTARRLLPLALPAALCAVLAGLPDPSRSAPAPLVRKRFTNSIGMKLVRIPAGKFKMGSPNDEADRQPGETQHEVQLTRSFYLGACEVTQAQYKKVIGTNPSFFSAAGRGQASVRGLNTDDFPVETVSWNEAAAFCKKLSALPAEKGARRFYRLPTEAEWEYACRAGARTYTPFHYGKALSSREANIEGTQPYGGAARGPNLGRPCKVGSYKPNGWGLYDMHGNVFEWCADWHAQDYYRTGPKKDPPGPATGSMRRLRGGGWMYAGHYARSAFRGWNTPDNKYNAFGFRVACDIDGRRR